MIDDPLLQDALLKFLFNSNKGNTSAIRDERKYLDDLTRQLIRTVYSNDSQEKIFLSPSLSMMAIHSIGKAASLCIDLTEEDDNPSSVPFAAVEFMTTAFGYLESDLVYTALRFPILISSSFPASLSSTSSLTSTSAFSKASANVGMTVIDVLANLCIDGTKRKVVDIHLEYDLGNDYHSESKWFDSKLRSFAFMSLCRGIQAAEMIQKISSSLQPYPVLPEDSALGAGMGLTIDLNSNINETISHLALDYILHIDAGCDESNPLSCVLCEDPIHNQGGYQECECESHRNRGYLYTACVVYLSILLRSNLCSWLHFNSRHFDSSRAHREHVEQKTLSLCNALARCISTLKDRNMKLQGRIAAFVSISLFSLILKNSQCELNDFGYGIFLESMTQIVLGGAIFRPTNLDSDKNNHRASHVMRKRAITALSDILSQCNKVNENPQIITSIQGAVEQCCTRILKMGGLPMQKWEESLLDPGLEGDLVCLLILQTLCKRITRPILTQLLMMDCLNSQNMPKETDPLPMMVKSLMRLSLSEKFSISCTASSVFRGLVGDRKGDTRSDSLSRKLWDIIETPQVCEQHLNRLLVQSLVFLKKNCDLKNIDCGEMIDTNSLIGFSETPFKIQLSRSEPRLCSLLDLFLFCCSGDALQKIKLENDFCASTCSVFGYIAASHIGNIQQKPILDFWNNGSCLQNDSYLHIAVIANVENILTRLGHLENQYGDAGSNEDHYIHSECRDCMTSQSLIKALSIITRHKIRTKSIPSDHASVGMTVASCLVQGSSRDLIRRGILLQNIVERRNIEQGIIARSIFEKCSLHEKNLDQEIYYNKKQQEEYIRLKGDLALTRNERDHMQLSLHMKKAQHEKELSFARIQSSADALALVDTHVHEREKAERDMMLYQSELANVKQNMLDMEKKLLETETQLSEVNKNLKNERKRAEEDYLKSSMQIEKLQQMVQDEKKNTIEKERTLSEKLQELDESNQELDALSEEHSSIVDRFESASQLLQESQGKVEMTCYKLVTLAEKYKEKETLIKDLNKHMTQEHIELDTDISNKNGAYNTLRLQCEKLLNENKFLRSKMNSSAQVRNNSAIAVALQEMSAEVPRVQNRDDDIKDRGRSEEPRSRERSTSRGRFNNHQLY